MKTELTEWQRKKVRGIIWNAFASTFEKLFYSSIVRVDDIPQVDDITPDQIVEASTAYMFTLYDNDRDTKIALIHSYTEGLKGELIDEVVFAVVTKNKEIGLRKKSKRPPIGDARSCMDDDNDF